MTSGRSSADSRPGAAAHTAGIAFDERPAVPITPGSPWPGPGGHLHVALVARRAGDDHAVAARADGLRPVGTQRRRRGG